MPFQLSEGMEIMDKAWSPDSWREKTVSQMPAYPDSEALREVVGQLGKLPPLVTSWEVERLKEYAAQASRGEAFVLQGGDCAENFEECESNNIANKLKILLQMSLVLLFGGKKKVIRVGRFAGQYAKPRSSDMETKGDETLPSYRGDMVNNLRFTSEGRIPDPQRLLRAYERSAMTMNFIRSLAAGGFADLNHPEYWRLDFVRDESLLEEYQAMGFPAAAMRNYLARLGWSHGDDEFFTDEQAKEWFDLDGIGKSAARFDMKKLEHLSGQHIAAADDDALVPEIQAYLAAAKEPTLSDADAQALRGAMFCLKDRAKTFPQLIEKAYFALADRPLEMDEKSAKALDDVSRGILAQLTPQLQNASWNRDALEEVVTHVAEANDTKLGKVAQPLRAALAGRSVSPSVFDMMLVLGRDETLARLGDVTA